MPITFVIIRFDLSVLQSENVHLILLGTFRMSLMPSLFIKAVKDICTINTFELLNILFSEVNCLHFGFTTRLFPDTTNDLSIYEV